MTDYAKRLDAIRGKWRWNRGMFTSEGYRVSAFHQDRAMLVNDIGAFKWLYVSELSGFTPSLPDPATQGCLVAQIRKRFPFFHTMNWEGLDDISWECSGINDAVDHENYKTEEAIIMAALEAM